MRVAVKDFGLDVRGVGEAVGGEGLNELRVEAVELSPGFGVVVSHL